MAERLYTDFTESKYRDLLGLAKQKYAFLSFSEFRAEGRHLFWRHDIDFSVHRAYALSNIETELGIQSTYFVNLHSSYYNIFEKEIAVLIDKIHKMGHSIGLHYDPAFYEGINKNGLEENLKAEKNIVENMLGVNINVFSFHNPTEGDCLQKNDEVIAGMVNTYSSYFMNKCGYCSDSNGYWRFESLEAVLVEARHEKLQVLTHPEWWTPEPMSPRNRINRCIEGRAQRNQQMYDYLLDKYGRRNIK